MSEPTSSFRKYLRENGWEMISSLVISVIGFFLALYIDSLRERRLKIETYRSLEAAIREEAEFNDAVLKRSFKPYYEQAYVAGDFSLSTVKSSLSNSLFVHYSEEKNIHLLNEYLRVIELSNGFAETTRIIRVVQGDVDDKMIEAWRENLAECENKIEEIKRVLPGMDED